MVDIYNLSVAYVGAVFLESNAENKDFSIFHFYAFEIHRFYGLVGHVSTHAVVQSSGGEHYSGQHTVYLGFLNEGSKDRLIC